MEKNYTIKKADKYIIENKETINTLFKPLFHFSPIIGWINDPNGLVWFNDYAHIFYQYYPYGSKSGAMHWGHARSKDLIVFEYLPVALAPDEEDGCFSGGATVFDNNLLLIYTKHFETDNGVIEKQAIALSSDGVNFIKKGTILDAENLPVNSNKNEFRDPNPYFDGKETYIFIGSKNNVNQGQVLIYRTSDFLNFNYYSTISGKAFGIMAECPDYFKIKGKEILIFSAVEYKSDNIYKKHFSGYAFISMKKSDIILEKEKQLDFGCDFYAPQTFEDGKGRRILIGWMDIWGSRFPTDELNHGWCGAYTVPRELKIIDDIMYQYPISELKKYRTCRVDIGQSVDKCFDAEIEFDNNSFIRVCGNNNEFFEFGFKEGKVYTDGENIALCPKQRRYSDYNYDEKVNIRVISDKSSIEIFIEGGKECASNRIYIDSDKYNLKISKGVRCSIWRLE